MTLGDLKEDVYTLIEEYNEDEDNYTEDEDLASKINGCINIIQNELSRFKKIDGYVELNVSKDESKFVNQLTNDIYQLNYVDGINYENKGNIITFKESGVAKIYYYKYPKRITDNLSDDYVLELDQDVLEIMPLGVAGLLLSTDPSNNFGNLYTNLYEQKIQLIDSRKIMPSIYIEGGI